MYGHYYKQLTDVVHALMEPQNAEVAGGVSVTMEEGQKFLVTKSCKGNVCIFNSDTTKIEKRMHVDNPRLLGNVMSFFVNKSNWIEKVEPLGPLAKSICRPIIHQPLHLTFEMASRLLSAFHRKDEILKSLVIDVRAVPMEYSVLAETHLKMVVTYYEDSGFDIVDVLDNL